MTTAISASDFVHTLGVNTHLDFAAYGYENVAAVESAIRYLGLVNLRDSAEVPTDAALWQQVAQATGAEFDDYIAETSPAGMAMDLGFVGQLASEGILNALEGGNEEDDAYPASLGNTLAATAQFQRQVDSLGRQLGLPVVNMSFGSGWSAANNWRGNYDKVGDLSAATDYANAHTYPVAGQLPDDTIDRLNGLAHLAAPSRPVITTEIGWDESQGFSPADIARYILDAAFDGIKYGNPKTYFYALYDDGSGRFGLMNPNGTAKPAGQALHNLTSILADSAPGAFHPGSLSYSLSSSDSTVLMQKSDGSFWLSVWNEHAAAHGATLTLGSAAQAIRLFDPLTGAAAGQATAGTSSFTFIVPDHPVVIEVANSVVPPSGGGTGTPVTTPDSGSQHAAPVIAAPSGATVAAGKTVKLAATSIVDAWAAAAPGNLALNVTASSGALTMQDASGAPAAGSGSRAIHLTGTLAQLDAALKSLSFTAATANASVSLDVWDQSGLEGSKTIAVAVTHPGVGVVGRGAAGTHLLASQSPQVVDNASNVQIVASAGDHIIFIGGTGDVVRATGGTETIHAYRGQNTIVTGAGNDTIRYAGAGNVIDAGAGNNALMDSGGNNTIVLAAGGQGYDDILGYVLQNGDRLDLRHMLAGTGWKGDRAGIGDFVKLTTSGSSTVIKVDPDGAAGGASYAVAKLEASGPVSLNTLLAHAIT